MSLEKTLIMPDGCKRIRVRLNTEYNKDLGIICPEKEKFNDLCEHAESVQIEYENHSIEIPAKTCICDFFIKEDLDKDGKVLDIKEKSLQSKTKDILTVKNIKEVKTL